MQDTAVTARLRFRCQEAIRRINNRDVGEAATNNKVVHGDQASVVVRLTPREVVNDRPRLRPGMANGRTRARRRIDPQLTRAGQCVEADHHLVVRIEQKVRGPNAPPANAGRTRVDANTKVTACCRAEQSSAAAEPEAIVLKVREVTAIVVRVDRVTRRHIESEGRVRSGVICKRRTWQADVFTRATSEIERSYRTIRVNGTVARAAMSGPAVAGEFTSVTEVVHGNDLCRSRCCERESGCNAELEFHLVVCIRGIACQSAQIQGLIT